MVLHDAMLGEAVAEIVIVTRLVRKHPRFFADVLLKYRHDGRGLQVVNDNRPRLTRSAINKAKHLHLVVIGALLRLARLPADERLIGLDDATAAAHRGEFARAHCLANRMREKPRCLVSDAEDLSV